MGSCVCLVISQTLNYIPALFLIFRYHSVTQASLELTTHLSEPLGGGGQHCENRGDLPTLSSDCGAWYVRKCNVSALLSSPPDDHPPHRPVFLLQMSKVWNDLKPKLSCLFAGPHSVLTPPRSPQEDGVCSH